METQARSSLQNTIAMKYGWYNFLFTLADEKFMNISKVTREPLLECLTFLSYKMDLDKMKSEYVNRRS